MKQKKFIIVFLVIAIIYSLIIILINRNDNSKKDNRAILIAGKDIFEYNNNILNKTDEINKDAIYNVYLNNNYYEKTSLKNKKISDYEGLVLAYSDNLNVNVQKIRVNKIDSNDLQIINSIISNVFNMNDFIVNERLDIDLDNNGIIDKIINVSNLNYEQEESIYFNLVYIVLNNGIEQILVKEIVPEREVLTYPSYYIYSTFNIDNYKYDNIIFQKRFFSLGGEPECLIYSYQNNQYLKINN